MSDDMDIAYANNYSHYAVLVIKQAESHHKALARQLHPDKQTSPQTVELIPRCVATTALLNNSLDTVREAFTRHIVPGAGGVEALFSLGDDEGLAVVVCWDVSSTLDTEIAVLGETDILALVTVPWDVGAHAFSFHDYPSLFKQDKIVVTVAHLGVFGAQVGFKSEETRVVLPTTEEVFECADHIEKGKQAAALKKQLRKLQADLRKRKHGAIGAACCDLGRSSKRQRWYEQDRRETRKHQKKRHQKNKRQEKKPEQTKHQHQAPWRASGNGSWGCDSWAKSSKNKKKKKRRSWRRR